jgi:hypothetical protein
MAAPQATIPVYDLSHHAVTVIIPVTIDASGGVVELFGEEAEMVQYQLTLKDKIAASTLYVAEQEGLLEYIELSGAGGPAVDGAERDGLDARFNKTAAGKALATLFAADLHSALCDKVTEHIDASAVYTGVGPTDQSYESFGDFVVSYIAQQVFGHPRATAAIANDSSIIARINASATINDAKWEDAENSTNPTGDIAIRLVQALRNLSEADGSGNGAPLGETKYNGREALRFMVRQMMLQDPARFSDERNELEWYALQFRAGDRLVFNIKLKGFTFSVQGNANAPSQYKDLYTPSVPETEFSILFDLE